MVQETPVLEATEVQAMLAQINTRTPSGARNYAMLQLMCQTGIRCGEALNVRPEDIRLEDWGTNGAKRRLWVLRLPARSTKGKRDRQGLPLAPETLTALQVWEQVRAERGIKGGTLFCTISEGHRQAGFAGDGELVPGKPINPRYVQELVKRLAAQAGIERRVTPHMLRHTALTRLYDETRNIRLVQQVAGHASIAMTERYTHVHPLELADAMGAVGEG